MHKFTSLEGDIVHESLQCGTCRAYITITHYTAKPRSHRIWRRAAPQQAATCHMPVGHRMSCTWSSLHY